VQNQPPRLYPEALERHSHEARVLPYLAARQQAPPSTAALGQMSRKRDMRAKVDFEDDSAANQVLIGKSV